jgi:hypothetical protein
MLGAFRAPFNVSPRSCGTRQTLPARADAVVAFAEAAHSRATVTTKERPSVTHTCWHLRPVALTRLRA